MALPDKYYDARKQLILFTGLLFAWEFVGITIDGKQTLDLGTVKVGVSRPDFIPFVFAVLVIYSVFRYTIEWCLAPAEDRMSLAARVDYKVSLMAALVATQLFFFHELVTQPGSWVIHAWGGGFMSGLALILVVLSQRLARKSELDQFRPLITGGLLLASFIAVAEPLMAIVFRKVPAFHFFSIMALSFASFFGFPLAWSFAHCQRETNSEQTAQPGVAPNGTWPPRTSVRGET
jgi:uncharacterized membrane protein